MASRRTHIVKRTIAGALPLRVAAAATYSIALPSPSSTFSDARGSCIKAARNRIGWSESAQSVQACRRWLMATCRGPRVASVQEAARWRPKRRSFRPSAKMAAVVAVAACLRSKVLSRCAIGPRERTRPLARRCVHGARTRSRFDTAGANARSRAASSARSLAGRSRRACQCGILRENESLDVIV